jgi:hypothetical protein
VVERNLAKVDVARSNRVTRSSLMWKGGRVVDCNGFENRRSESYRGFESLPFRRQALLVELVDTLVLGTSASGVRVRVPRRAFIRILLNHYHPYFYCHSRICTCTCMCICTCMCTNTNSINFLTYNHLTYLIP